MIYAREGVAFIEFAFVAPFLLLLLFGGIELARYILIAQRLDAATGMLATVVSQYEPATDNTKEDGKLHQDYLSTDVFPLARRVMLPCDEQTDCAARFSSTYNYPEYVAILTAVRRESDGLKVKWQMGGGGSYGGVASLINGGGPNNPPNAGVKDGAVTVTGETRTLLNNMRLGEVIIVAESFYNYTPLYQTLLERLGWRPEAAQMYRAVYMPPRKGDLICLPPTFLYSGVCQ